MKETTLFLGAVLALLVPERAMAQGELVGVFTINYRYNSGGCSWGHPNPYYCTYVAPGPVHLSAAPGRYRIVFLDAPGANEPGSDAWSGDASTGTFIELDKRGATFNHTSGDITLFYNDWYPWDNDTNIETAMALYRLADVDCYLAASYADGALTLDFSIQTAEAVTWNAWLSTETVMHRLWSVPLPAGLGPLTAPLSIPGFPQLGEIGLLTTFTTADRGITCSDWKLLDTGVTPSGP